MTTDRNPMSGEAVLARITGQVQGVCYRAWTREQARRFGLKGWVRNQPDGSVAALIAGPEAAVKEMVEILHQGPPGAKVASVEVETATSPDAPGFHILR
jgi:acylphosphatase